MKFKEYEFNLLGADEYLNQNSSRLRFYYKHLKNNAKKYNGDIFEFGVFRGNSLITAALILKKLNSRKKVFGFDSFKGFPSYSKYDDLKNFYNLKYFNKSFLKQYKKFLKVKKITGLKKITPVSIASSGNFNKTSYELVKQKIDYFKLKNIELIKGDFKKTVPQFFNKKNINISSCNIDCDLYDSYKIILPYVYNNLTKGGYIHLDEYYSFKYPGGKIATDKFCKKHKLRPKKNIVRAGEFERFYLDK